MKIDRKKTIKKIISENVITTQVQLKSRLEEIGFKVTQATVSRDIKDLGIYKGLDENGKLRYLISKDTVRQTRYSDILMNSVISITSAMNDVVLRCHVGTASAACAAIDKLFDNYFLGSLAGDDTIFIVTESPEKALELVEKINLLFI